MHSRHGENPTPSISANIYIFRLLLVSLNIAIYLRQERFNKMTDGLELEGVYGVAIGRIKVHCGDKSWLGMGALI